MIKTALLTGSLCVFFMTGARAELITFENTTAIGIPALGMANPYPSTIGVSGVTRPIVNITMTLHGFSHTFPDDVGAVVVAPTGTAVLLFSGAGTGANAVNLTLTFDDRAPSGIPLTTPFTSGTYQPGAAQWDDFFPDPGPGGDDVNPPWGFAFEPLRFENPNGGWNLFVIDANGGDAGSISRGWSITFEVVPEPSSGVLVLLIGGAVTTIRRRR